MSLYLCSVCGLRIGDPDQDYCDEPSRPCPSCALLIHPARTFDADELGIDPEEEFE